MLNLCMGPSDSAEYMVTWQAAMPIRQNKILMDATKRAGCFGALFLANHPPFKKKLKVKAETKIFFNIDIIIIFFQCYRMQIDIIIILAT